MQTDHQKTLLRVQEITTNQIELVASNDDLHDRNDALVTELNDLTQLAVSVISIDDENKELRDEHDSLLHQIDALSVANQELQDASDQQWFLTGAGTLLFGMLLGFWISRRIVHNRSSRGWT